MIVFFNILNKLVVKLETSFLEQMCPKYCRSSKKSFKTRQQWQSSKRAARSCFGWFFQLQYPRDFL